MLSTLAGSDIPAVPLQQPAIATAHVTPVAATSVTVPDGIFVPAQIRDAYGLNLVSDQGQGETVAIVDAYSQPNIANDLAVFSQHFGLPQMNGVGGNPTFSIKVPTGQSTPAPNAGWGLEISLDVEWVHAIAPYANIDLVECQSANDSLFGAEVEGETYASGVVYAASLPGVVVVSNSYGSGEFSGETYFDAEFSNPKVAFTFSTGNQSAPAEYPAYSPNVIAVGATSLTTLSIKGAYGFESGWSGGGGGVSVYESTPSYQSGNGVSFGGRSAPDVSMDGNPNTGVFVYDSYSGGYFEVGGTSLSSPLWAGLIALGDQARGAAGSLNSTNILDSLYSAYHSASYSTDFHDVTAGSNGFSAGTGYDLVTGIGTPKAPGIVSLLSSYSSAAVVVKTTPGTGGGGFAALPGTRFGGGQSAARQMVISLDVPWSATPSSPVLAVGDLSDLIPTIGGSLPTKKTTRLLGSE
jgi:subtilase family serine protease